VRVFLGVIACLLSFHHLTNNTGLWQAVILLTGCILHGQWLHFLILHSTYFFCDCGNVCCHTSLCIAAPSFFSLRPVRTCKSMLWLCSLHTFCSKHRLRGHCVLQCVVCCWAQVLDEPLPSAQTSIHTMALALGSHCLLSCWCVQHYNAVVIYGRADCCMCGR
jgi:hypothetical protein